MVNSKIRVLVVPESEEGRSYNDHLRGTIALTSEDSAAIASNRSLDVFASQTPTRILQEDFGLPKRVTMKRLTQRELKFPVQTKRRVPIEYPRWSQLFGKRTMCTLVTSYGLACPSLPHYLPKRRGPIVIKRNVWLSRSTIEGRVLYPDVPISKQGIVNNTILVLIKDEELEFDNLEDYPIFGRWGFV